MYLAGVGSTTLLMCCADLDCFSELPPGASKELRDWADENDKLEDLADNLLRLDASRKQLRLPLVTGAAR